MKVNTAALIYNLTALVGVFGIIGLAVYLAVNYSLWWLLLLLLVEIFESCPIINDAE